MNEHAVVIVGAGPTGLMLAGELALPGVDVVVVERRADQEVEGSRARGLHARTIEVLDQRGVAERFVTAGRPRPHVGFARTSLDITDLPSRHNYLLGLFQADVERLLADWVLGELGVAIVRSCEVVGLAPDDDGVDVRLSSGGTIRARFVVVATAGAAWCARRRVSTSPGGTRRPAS